MTRDRLALLHQIRPEASLDLVWTAQQQTAAQERIMLDQSPTSTGTTTSPVPGRRRRVATIAGTLALGLLALPGAAAAVNNGMSAQSFAQAYGNWQDNRGVDPLKAQRLGSIPGPSGQMYSVVGAANDTGVTCLTMLFESAASAKQPAPDFFEGGGNFCDQIPSRKPFGFNGRFSSGAVDVWIADAGTAVRGITRMADGTTYPAILAQGYLFGWFPILDRDAPALVTVIGYAADGSEVGQIHI